MPTRRKALIGIGTVGITSIAGCSSSEPESEPETTENGTESEPIENVTQEELLENTTEEDLENETEEVENEIEEEEPTDRELFQQSLEEAEGQYRFAFEEYGKSTEYEDATLMHVYPSTESEQHDARDYLGNAADILWEDTRDLAPTEEDEQKVREYRTYEDFIIDLHRIQTRIYKAYTVITPVEQGSSAYDRGQLDDAIEIHKELADYVEDNEMYMDELETKHEQLDWQINLMEDMFNGLENVEGATDFVLLSGTALQLAREDFNSVVEELEDTESAPPKDITDEDMLELAEDYYEAVDEALREVTQSSDN